MSSGCSVRIWSNFARAETIISGDAGCDCNLATVTKLSARSTLISAAEMFPASESVSADASAYLKSRSHDAPSDG